MLASHHQQQNSSTSSKMIKNPRILIVAVFAICLIFLFLTRREPKVSTYADTPYFPDGSTSPMNPIAKNPAADLSTGSPAGVVGKVIPGVATSGIRPVKAKPTNLPADDALSVDLSAPFLKSNKVAVMVEDRPLANIVPIMLHFSSVLGPDWPVVLYTGTSIRPNSAALHRAMKENRIIIRQLPSDVHFAKHADVSAFLTKAWFWNDLAPADHVLLFQADSVICANAPQRMEDFLEWDLIGAPIAPQWGKGFNGGLSLRNRNMILSIIESSNFANETQGPGGTEVEFEDQWFYKKMSEMPPNEDGSPGAKLPSIEVAQTFAVETIMYDHPLGYHQPQRWQPDNLPAIEEWCPEVRLCTSNLIVKSGAQ